MKNKKKVYIIIASIIILSLFLSVVFIKIFFSLTIPEKDIKNSVISLFKTKLNRAVKFEVVKVSLAGNIIINRFDLSVSSDFNDNLSLISSPEIIIDLGFIDLFLGRMTIKGIQINDADINILKRYGKDYSEVSLQFIDLTHRINKIAQSQDGTFYIAFNNCRLAYREILKDTEININFFDINASLMVFPDKFSYILSTAISPSKTIESNKGSISSEGEFDT